MKGPAQRLLLDVRRSWKCPRCGYTESVGAQVTSLLCPCCSGTRMKLVEEKRAYADELRKLKNAHEIRAVTLEERLAEAVASPQDAGNSAKGAHESPAAGSESNTPKKRRGKRPRKRPRRELKQQPAPDSTGTAETSPADCEE